MNTVVDMTPTPTEIPTASQWANRSVLFTYTCTALQKHTKTSGKRVPVLSYCFYGPTGFSSRLTL